MNQNQAVEYYNLSAETHSVLNYMFYFFLSVFVSDKTYMG